MLLYCTQSEGLVENYFLAFFSMDTINMLLALKKCVNVCPGPQELYTSRHIGREPYKEGVHHIYSILHTLATTYCGNGLEIHVANTQQSLPYIHIYIYIPCIFFSLYYSGVISLRMEPCRRRGVKELYVILFTTVYTP